MALDSEGCPLAPRPRAPPVPARRQVAVDGQEVALFDIQEGRGAQGRQPRDLWDGRPSSLKGGGMGWFLWFLVHGEPEEKGLCWILPRDGP